MKIFKYKLEFCERSFFAYGFENEVYGLILSKLYVPFFEEKISNAGGEISNGKNSDKIPIALKKYFETGNLPSELNPKPLWGTDFQRTIWRKISELCSRKTTTYGEIAKTLGKPQACRAVGSAVGANPIAIVVPCHRVLAKNGIGGFGNDAELKKRLLEHEGFKVR